MQKLTTWLWFESEAEDAARFYMSVFPNAKLGAITYAPGGGEPHMTEGAVLTVEFEIEGHPFVGLNGGPHPGAQRSDSISFQILCADQEEIDEYWTRLTADGGQEVQCGWLKDKYGFSWQIVPEILPELMAAPDRRKAARVTQAMMAMIRLDIAALEEAARG